MSQPQSAAASTLQTLHFLVHTMGAKRRLQVVKTDVPDDAEAIRRAIVLPGEVVFYAQRLESGDHLVTVDDRLARIDSIGGLTSILRVRFWNGREWDAPQIIGVDSIARSLPPLARDAIHAALPENDLHTACGLRRSSVNRVLRQMRAATCPVCREAAVRLRSW